MATKKPMCNHDNDIKEIRNDIKKILLIVGKVAVHEKIIFVIVVGLIGFGIKALAG